MQVQDVYKLIYQGTLGPEHMVATRQEFTRSLEAEFSDIEPGPGHLLEPIRADQVLYRLNLRPYKLLQQGISALVGPLLMTSKHYVGDKTRLMESWADFIEICSQEKLDMFTTDTVEQFNHWLEKEDYPAVHHSEAYRQAYRPAYRLILAQYITELNIDVAS